MILLYFRALLSLIPLSFYSKRFYLETLWLHPTRIIGLFLLLLWVGVVSLHVQFLSILHEAKSTYEQLQQQQLDVQTWQSDESTMISVGKFLGYLLYAMPEVILEEGKIALPKGSATTIKHPLKDSILIDFQLQEGPVTPSKAPLVIRSNALIWKEGSLSETQTLENWLGKSASQLQWRLDEPTKSRFLAWLVKLVGVSMFLISPLITLFYFVLKAVIFFAAFAIPCWLFRMMKEPTISLKQWVLLAMAASVPILLIENTIFLGGVLIGFPALHLPQSLHFAIWCAYFLYGMHMNRQAVEYVQGKESL